MEMDVLMESLLRCSDVITATLQLKVSNRADAKYCVFEVTEQLRSVDNRDFKQIATAPSTTAAGSKNAPK